MKKYKYDDTLATGTVAAAGTLGILIPPSTVLIVYGILTEQSIGKLFIAGIVPGILLSIFFAATVAYLCLRDPSIGPPGTASTWKERLKALTGIIEALLLFILAVSDGVDCLYDPADDLSAHRHLFAELGGLLKKHPDISVCSFHINCLTCSDLL